MNQFLLDAEERKHLTRLNENAESGIAFTSADIGRHFGADRIALHHLAIEPGFRTSLPHAESHEEEFVLVLKGAPSVWIDGTLYELDEGDFVGFPAGTGSHHSVLNNSAAVCELLVGGERTKSENKCAFSLNPEMKSVNAGIWWDNPPARKFGNDLAEPKVGSPGEHRISARPENLQNWRFVSEGLPFSYPTCERGETFSQGRDLTGAVNLSRVGCYLDRLAPGKRSSWPHAHSAEDEILYVVEGAVKVWVNGEIFPARAGDCIGFKSGKGDVHTFINDGSQDVFLFVLGERQHLPDLIYYSHHPKQNEHNQGRGCLWTERPHIPLGSASPDPEARL